MKKIHLKEHDMYNLISESVKRTLKEMYNLSNGVFKTNNDLMNLEKIVYKFTLDEVDVDYDKNTVNFNEFVGGLIKLHKMSIEKQEFDRLNVKQFLNKDNEEEYWNNRKLFNFEFIDDYANNMELWDKFMPKPEFIENGVLLFIEWLENYTDDEIEQYSKNKWSEFNSLKNKLNKII